MDEEKLEALVKNAKRFALIAILGSIVTLAVLLIDNGIKRDILAEAQRTRGMLDKIGVLNGEQASEQVGDSDQPSGNGYGGRHDVVVNSVPAGESVHKTPTPRDMPQRRRENSLSDRTSGNGR